MSNITCDPKDLSDLNENNMRYIGWETLSKQSPELKILFSEDVFRKVSAKITELLKGVHPEGKPIVVSNRVIGHMISSIYENEPLAGSTIGDIYSRFIIPQSTEKYCMLRSIIDRTINNISDYIRNEYEMAENNKKLTIWTTMYGEFNEHGLRAHAPINIRKKRPQSMMFNMNY